MTAYESIAPPPILYKYLKPSDGLLVLKSLKVRFTQPSLLNDLLDLRIELDAAPLARLLLPEVMTRLPTPVRELLDRPGVADSPEMAHWLTATIDSELAAATGVSTSALANHVGVLCLSESPESPIMWSHYASSHEGIVIGLRTESSLFAAEPGKDPILCRPWPVRYRRMRPLLRSRASRRFEAGLLGQFVTKGSGWQYEMEWRAFRAFSHGCRMEGLDQRNYPICLREFEPSDLVTVILGARMSDEDTEKVMAVLSQDCLNHVQVLRARASAKVYGLEFVQIPIGERDPILASAAYIDAIMWRKARKAASVAGVRVRDLVLKGLAGQDPPTGISS